MFEALLYIVAIVAVLAFFGEPRHTTTEETTAPATSEPTAEPVELDCLRQDSLTQTPATTEPTETVTPEPATELITEAQTATPAADLSALSVTELRRLATLARYPWRNAHGPNRHATKRELIAALS